MGSQYSLWSVVKSKEGGKLNEFDIAVNEGLVRYSMGISKRNDIPFFEKMQTLSEGALGLKKLREIRGQRENKKTEQEFTQLVDLLCKVESAKGLTPAAALHTNLAYAFIKLRLIPEFWLGTEIVDVAKQPEPKPYKTAINAYQNLSKEAETLLTGKLIPEDQREAELVWLEAQTWVCHLMQDNGIVLSHDYSLDQAKTEQFKLQKALTRVEENPLSKTKDVINTIHKARLISLDFWKYNENHEGFQKLAELTAKYIPEIFPSLEGPFPEPEGRPDVRYGAAMLLWRGVALKELGQTEDAIIVLTKIKVGMDERYDDPYIGGSPIRSIALSYLNQISQIKASSGVKKNN